MGLSFNRGSRWHYPFARDTQKAKLSERRAAMRTTDKRKSYLRRSVSRVHGKRFIAADTE